jgi:hypothetical protein
MRLMKLFEIRDYIKNSEVCKILNLFVFNLYIYHLFDKIMKK